MEEPSVYQRVVNQLDRDEALLRRAADLLRQDITFPTLEGFSQRIEWLKDFGKGFETETRAL